MIWQFVRPCVVNDAGSLVPIAWPSSHADCHPNSLGNAHICSSLLLCLITTSTETRNATIITQEYRVTPQLSWVVTIQSEFYSRSQFYSSNHLRLLNSEKLTPWICWHLRNIIVTISLLSSSPSLLYPLTRFEFYRIIIRYWPQGILMIVHCASILCFCILL